MEQTLGDAPVLSQARQEAATLLREGLPINLTRLESQRFIERCDMVLGALEPDDALLEVKLLTAQTVAETHRDIEAAMALADRVAERASGLTNDVADAYGQLAWAFTRSTPEHTAERARAATRILETAVRHRETDLVASAYIVLLVALLEQGEIRSLDIELLKQRVEGAEELGASHVNVLQRFQCLRMILDGETAEAEALAETIYSASPKHGTDALGLYTTQLGMIRWMQGRVDGAEDGFLAARREYPDQLLWAASLAWLWFLQGRTAAAEALLASLPDIPEIPRDRYWLSTIVVLAEVARVRGDRARAVQVRDTLLPFAGHLVTVGVGVAFWGTAARTLGLLEERLGMLEDARAHLELAIDMSGKIGALAWHAEAQIELAEFALRHGLSDVPAYELLEEARATSRARGFEALLRRAMHRPRIHVLGRFEVISLNGIRAEWTSRKARDLLKMLVAARGVAMSREVLMHALWPDEPAAVLGNRFSVAINVIRRALDPDRLLPTQYHVITEGESVRLNLETVDVDLERFFTLAQRPDEASRGAALTAYQGDAFSDEPYADWAVGVRDHARSVHARLLT